MTGKRREVYETVKAPDTRAGAKLADARLAELISAIEAGRDPEANHRRRSTAGITFSALAERWEEANAPRQNARTGDWIGWSPKTAKTHRHNFEQYILPSIGHLSATSITSLDLD